MSTLPATSAAATARRELGLGGVFTPAQAAILLGGEKAAAWLEREGLVHVVPGLGERVIWAEVVERLREAPTSREPANLPPPAQRRWPEANY